MATVRAQHCKHINQSRTSTLIYYLKLSSLPISTSKQSFIFPCDYACARTGKSTGRNKIMFYCVYAKLVRENKKKQATCHSPYAFHDAHTCSCTFVCASNENQLTANLLVTVNSASECFTIIVRSTITK